MITWIQPTLGVLDHLRRSPMFRETIRSIRTCLSRASASLALIACALLGSALAAQTATATDRAAAADWSTSVGRTDLESPDRRFGRTEIRVSCSLQTAAGTVLI
jgi:hypothetical protein